MFVGSTGKPLKDGAVYKLREREFLRVNFFTTEKALFLVTTFSLPQTAAPIKGSSLMPGEGKPDYTEEGCICPVGLMFDIPGLDNSCLFECTGA